MLQEKAINLKDFEEKLFAAVCRAGREVYAEALTLWDEELHKNRDRSVYRDKGKPKTTIKTLMGEVEYHRHVYSVKDSGGARATVYLLDEAIGKTGSGFFSEAFLERVGDAVCELPYRKAAAELSELTGQPISHGAVWNVTQQLGRRVDEIEQENAEKAHRNKGAGEIEAKLLFEEQDGIYLHLQGKDRKKHGKGHEMKLAIAYDGAEKKGKDRYVLSGKVACANFEGIEKFYLRKEGAIAANYNADEIELRVLGGDGGIWIKRSIGADTVYQLDTFHRNRAILRAAPDPETRNAMLKALYSKETDYLLTYIETLADSGLEEKQEEALRELFAYFTNNKDGLIGYNRRGLALPEPPEGKVYRRLGAMESNIFSIIGNRMKGRRKCWSIEGGNNLAMLLCLKATGKLHSTLQSLASVMPERYAEEVISGLSSAKVKESAGKGYNGFDSAALPASQKWLKAIVGLRPLSELRF